MYNEIVVGPQTVGDTTRTVARGGRTGEQMVSELQAAYYEMAYRQKLFNAYATVTAPVIYSTAAGTGGPLLWNGSSSVNAVILAVGYSVSVVTTVAGSIGLTGNTGQVAAPGSTTAIDAGPRNNFLGGVAPLCTTYRIGTPTNAGNFFIPLADMHTGALTVDNAGVTWVDLKGCLIVPPQAWISLAGSATLTTLQIQASLIWSEVPV